MALLITGAAGYVGSHILQVLPNDYKRDCLTPSIEEMDLSDYGSLRKYFEINHITKVLHLAAMIDNSAKRELLLFNLTALYNLAKLSLEFGVEHFVMASTNNVYGVRDNIIPIKEDEKRNPYFGNDYGLTKYLGELLVEDIFKGSNTKFAVLRIGDIYGPNQRASALIKGVVSNIESGQPQKLYGKGERVRDYIYIDDVAMDIVHALCNDLSGFYNLGTGVGTSVKQIVSIAESLSTCKEPTVPVKVDKEDTSKVVLETNKLIASGFHYSVSFEDGLKQILKEGGKS